MKPYQEYVGRLIDQGLDNTVIVKRVLAAETANRVIIPIKQWAKIDRYHLILNAGSTATQNIECASKFNQEPPLGLFLDETPFIMAMRQVLQNSTINLSLETSKSRLKIEQSGLRKYVELFFPTEKEKSLHMLGLKSGKGEWSEERFQKTCRFIRDAKTAGITPNFSLLQFWLSDSLDLDGHWRKLELPFEDVLGIHSRKSLSVLDLRIARKLAKLFLQPNFCDPIRPIDVSIRAKDIRHIEKCSHWLQNSLDKPFQHLQLIALMSSNGEKINCRRMETITQFINRHIKKAPDPDLLADYLGCYVTFDGKGRYQK